MTSPKFHLCVFAVFILWASPAAVALAQGPDIVIRAPIETRPDVGLPPSALNMASAAYPNGDSIVAFEFYGQIHVGSMAANNPGTGKSVALVKVGASGDVYWVHHFHEDNSVYDVLALPDGGALLSGSLGPQGVEEGALVSFDADGRQLWRLSSVVPSDSLSLLPTIDPTSGRLLVSGSFSRGRMQLPGTRLLRGPRRFNSFVGEVELDGGAVRWLRPVRDDITGLSFRADGSILVTSAKGRGGALYTVGRIQDVEQRGFRTQQRWQPPRGQRIWSAAAFDSGGIAMITVGIQDRRIPRRRPMQLVGYDRRGRQVFQRALAVGREHRFVRSPASDRITLFALHDLREEHIEDPGWNGVLPQHGSMVGDTIELRSYSPSGQTVGLHGVQVPNHVFTTKLDVRRQRGHIQIAGLFADPRQISQSSVEGFVLRVRGE